MNVSKKTLAAIAATGAIAIGVTVPAVAQEADEPTTTQEQTVEERREERKAEFAEALAAELGIDVDTLTEALENVKEDFKAERLAELRVRLDEKVAAGELTQEQADEIYARAEEGDFPRRDRRGHGRAGGFGPGGPDGAPGSPFAEGTAA